MFKIFHLLPLLYPIFTCVDPEHWFYVKIKFKRNSPGCSLSRSMMLTPGWWRKKSRKYLLLEASTTCVKEDLYPATRYPVQVLVYHEGKVPPVKFLMYILTKPWLIVKVCFFVLTLQPCSTVSFNTIFFKLTFPFLCGGWRYWPETLNFLMFSHSAPMYELS